MCNKTFTIFSYIIGIVVTIVCSNKSKARDTYHGEYIPIKYLEAETNMPSQLHLNWYLQYLKQAVNYFVEPIRVNDTGIELGLGSFLTKAILKRTLKDSGAKLSVTQFRETKAIMNNLDTMISHFLYSMRVYDLTDLEFRVSRLLKDEAPQVYSLRRLNRNQLKPLLLSKHDMHPYIKEMDAITLRKEDFVELSEHPPLEYTIRISDSDKCLSRIMFNPEPINISSMSRCRPDTFCEKRILKSPSIAYGLSHRFLNLLLLRNVRRCYLQSEDEDALSIDTMCSFMYREAVYLARRGFFFRDLFLEHVAFCGMMGYEEFFRMHWFRKVISWYDNQGCLTENRNMELNRSVIILAENQHMAKKLRRQFREVLNEECRQHPMILAMMVLGHAVRYTANYLTGKTL